jgi:hypothetical protein
LCLYEIGIEESGGKVIKNGRFAPKKDQTKNVFRPRYLKRSESRETDLGIAPALDNRSGIDASHLITRDSRAELQLGGARLTRDSMFGKYADELSKIVLAVAVSAVFSPNNEKGPGK